MREREWDVQSKKIEKPILNDRKNAKLKNQMAFAPLWIQIYVRTTCHDINFPFSFFLGVWVGWFGVEWSGGKLVPRRPTVKYSFRQFFFWKLGLNSLWVTEVLHPLVQTENQIHQFCCRIDTLESVSIIRQNDGNIKQA